MRLGLGLTFVSFCLLIIITSKQKEFEGIDKDLFYQTTYNNIHSKMLEYKSKPFNKISVTITIYNPTKEQCGNNKGITQSGLKITKPIRWVALSPDLLKKFPHFSKIKINIPLAPQMNGIYMVTDKTSNKFTNRVDILIANPHEFKCHFKLDGYILYK